MDEPVLEYQQPDRTSPAAVVVLCLAFFGALLFVFVVPPLVMMFAAALVRNGLSLQRDPRGHHLATAAVRVSGGAVIAGAAAFVVLSMPFHHSREISNRSYCAANLRSITMAMNIYAEDGGWYPIVGPSYSSTLASALPSPTGPAATLLSNKPGGLYTGAMPGNVCQSMWLLVIEEQVAAKQFLCKSDPAGAAAAPSTLANTTDYYANFTSDPSGKAAATDQTYSYSFAFMWTATGKIGEWWKSETDAGLPLIADMAPANGTGPAGSVANTLNGADKLANSRNHAGDGQNIGYGDGHAEFARLANAGQRDDNIYSANGALGPSPSGTTPSSAADPFIAGGRKGNWDVVLVPAADVVSNVRK